VLPKVFTGTPTPQNLFGGGGAACDDDPSDYCCYFGFDPVCGGGGYPPGFPFPFPGGGGSGPVTIIEGVQESTVWSDIWGALTGLWSIIVGAVDAAIVAAIKGIQAAVSAIAQALSDAFHTLARLAGLILKFLQKVFKDIVGALAAAVKEIGRRLGQLIDKVFKPILKALNAIRQRLLQIYGRYIRPILIILQKVRQVLAILKAFHIKWAAKLDAKLADLEYRIMQPFLQLLGYVNLLANFLNLVFTAYWLIQRPIWLNTLNANKGSTIALQINSMNPTPNSADLAAIAAGGQLDSPQKSMSDADQYLTTGTGDLTPYIALANSTFQETVQQG
jgi:hypothetical protein